MKRALVSILVVFLLIGGVVVALMLRSERVQPPTSNPAFPTSPTRDTDTERTFTVLAQNGTAVIVRRFIDDGTTIADPQNPGDYVLTGSLGYCLEDGSCPSTGENDFTTVYFERDQAFMIGLGAEPLGEVRRRAEAALAASLGLEPAQLCTLRVTVGVPYDVNATYGSYENLGLPSCPGSIPLP